MEINRLDEILKFVLASSAHKVSLFSRLLSGFGANLHNASVLANERAPTAAFGASVFYFVHIPKTAGTAFRLELESHFEPAQTLPNAELRRALGGYPTFEWLAQLPAVELDSYRLICGHYQYRQLQARFTAPPLLLIVLRDPLSRCLSECKHILRHPDHDMRRFLPEQPTLEDISQSHEVMHYLQYLVAMVLLPDLEASKALIRNCAFVGIQERLTVSNELLAKTFGWQSEGIRQVNVSPDEQQALADQIPAEIKARFEAILEWDRALYHYANEVLDARLKAAGLVL